MAATTPPLSLGEILDRTVQLYRRNFVLLVGIALLPSAVDVLFSGGIGIYFSSRMPAIPTPGQPGAPPIGVAGGASPMALLTTFLILALVLLIGIPLLLAISAVALSALNYAASYRNNGDPTSIRASYAYGFRLFWRHVGILFLQFLLAGVIPFAVFFGVIFFGTMLIAIVATTGAGKVLGLLLGLLVFVLVLAVLVVAVWIWLRYCLAFPASLAEGKKAWPSLQRSAQLTKGSRGRIFVMYLMVVILTLVAYYALSLPVDIVLKLTLYKSMDTVALMMRPPLVLQVINLLISFLERALVMPIYSVALLLFYNDQRTRQEGYDIELLMAQAGWSALTPPPQPTAPPAFPPTPVAPLAIEPDSSLDSPPAPPIAPGFSPDIPGAESIAPFAPETPLLSSQPKAIEEPPPTHTPEVPGA